MQPQPTIKKESRGRNMEECKISKMYNLEETIAKDLFEGLTYPWEALPKISEFIVKLGESLDSSVYEKRGENIWVAKSAKVAPTAFLSEPLIIDEEAEIRHCAFVRGNAIVGKGCVVGNSTELKNVVLFNSVQVPHYNYVGDSILGYKSHMGAGSITSNVKSDKTLVVVKNGKEEIKTGLKKFGAMLGDYVEVGCNSVLNPGSVIGSHTNIYPLSMVRGVVPERSIYKNKNELTKARVILNGESFNLEYTGDKWKEFCKTIDVTSNTIDISFYTDTNKTVYISDLMGNLGSEKQTWEQNANETYTDAVQIGKGIQVNSSETNTYTRIDSDGNRVFNKATGDVISEFTDKGMETKDMIVNGKAEIAGLLIQKVSSQIWLSSLL